MLQLLLVVYVTRIGAVSLHDPASEPRNGTLPNATLPHAHIRDRPLPPLLLPQLWHNVRSADIPALYTVLSVVLAVSGAALILWLSGSMKEPPPVEEWTGKVAEWVRSARLVHENDALLFPAAAMLLLQFLQAPCGVPLNASFAIVPRTLRGLLLGVPFAPFLHGSWAHFGGNMAGWFTLGIHVLRDGVPAFACAFLAVAGGGGALLWLCGRPAAHVGLSGVLYGFWGMLFASVPLKRHWLGRGVRVLIVGAIYGPLEFLHNATPAAAAGTSWEGHLCGLVAGVLWALLYYAHWTLLGRDVGGFRSYLYEKRVWVPVSSLPPEMRV